MCDKHKFVQIHCHSDGSLLDGAGSIEKLVKKAKSYGHPAFALTDHGGAQQLYGFYKECKKHDIKPILGLEFYICNDLREKISYKERTSIEDRDYHQSIYIKDKEGYVNFNYMTYMAHTEGYYYKPRIDFDLLFERSKGLMVTSSCMASKISQYTRANKEKDSEILFKKFLDKFGEDFYGEIQFNEVEGQKEINDVIIKLCKKYDVPILIGGDVHYVEPEDNVLQDAIIRSKRGNEDSDWTISARNLYYHDVSDYYNFNKKFGYNYDEKLLEECFENSIKFSEKPNFQFETGKYHFPKIKIEGNQSSIEILEELSWKGLEKRITTRKKYGEKFPKALLEEYEKRLEYELSVIDKLHIADYFLIVQDIINWEKDNGYYVGPGRGSAAGSLVAYCTGICDVCPIEGGLIFERFINETRLAMPDIDYDSSRGARDAVLQYLVEKYGPESVCNVGTFMEYGPKSAIQDMSRGLGIDTGANSVLMRKITKLPELEDTRKTWKPGDLVSYFKELRNKTTDLEVIEWLSDNFKVIEYAERIQGQMRQLGTHAGGILITPEPVYNFIPVTRGGGNLISAFREADGSSKDLSELGLMKLDVLGLSTLNIFKSCVASIKRDLDIDLSEKIYYLNKQDKEILDYFALGNNYGIFQMDRSKMFTSKMKIDNFEDIVAINAMNRPGPLEKFLNKYGYWKDIDQGNIKVSEEELVEIDKERYPFPFMRKVLSPTFGCLLYQEQFMFLVKEAAGFTLGEADSFRRVIGWAKDHPKYHTVEKYFVQLEQKLIEKGYTKEDSDKFVQYCRDFTGYSFNKSHSYAYSYVSYQCLFFKYYYPAYWYAEMINNENDNDKFTEIIADAKLNGIEFLPFSIIKSNYLTKVESEKQVRLGFHMIKGISDSVEEELKTLKLNECKTIEEVLSKPFKKINSTQLSNLIDIGCFDEFGVHRNRIEILRDLYTDDKIEFWFTRKKQPVKIESMPKSLSDNFDKEEVLKLGVVLKSKSDKLNNDIFESFFGEEDDSKEKITNFKPHIELIKELTNKIKIRQESDKTIIKRTIKRQKELIGFSLLEDNEVEEFERAFQLKGILPIREFQEELKDKDYYFVVKDIKEALTKTNKKYLNLVLSDGVSDYKFKAWSLFDLSEGSVYYGKIKKDNYGWTLNKVYSVDK